MTHRKPAFCLVRITRHHQIVGRQSNTPPFVSRRGTHKKRPIVYQNEQGKKNVSFYEREINKKLRHHGRDANPPRFRAHHSCVDLGRSILAIGEGSKIGYTYILFLCVLKKEKQKRPETLGRAWINCDLMSSMCEIQSMGTKAI